MPKSQERAELAFAAIRQDGEIREWNKYLIIFSNFDQLFNILALCIHNL